MNEPQQMTSPPELSMEYWRQECQRLAGLLSEARSDRNAEVARLEAEKRGLEEERELLVWMNHERLTVTWNPYHMAFIVQRPEQVVGNIGKGPTVTDALRAARSQKGAA
jgi:hypothetical protein